jgi:hypothetical protein
MRRSRKYRKKKHGGEKVNPNLAGRRRKEREEQELALKLVLNKPGEMEELKVDEHEDFE